MCGVPNVQEKKVHVSFERWIATINYVHAYLAVFIMKMRVTDGTLKAE